MMDEKGMADLEVIMGGHSSAISNSHYKKQIEKVQKADVPAI